MKNPHRRLMILIAGWLTGAAFAWALSLWRDADQHGRWWIVSVCVCIAGMAVVAVLRGLGKI